MYTGTNPSALRSRAEIVDAFISLLSKTTLDKLSIKEIMNETGLTRQTFYKIFSSKEEILEFYLDTIFEAFIEHSKQYTVNNLCDAAQLFFKFFEEYKYILDLFIKNGKSCVVQRKCREYLHREEYIKYAIHGVKTDIEKEYASTFVISGMVAMLEQWIQEDKPSITPTEMADLICRMTNTDSEIINPQIITVT